MTIVYEGDGDVFSSDRQTLVCPVNTRGAMGAGLARAFRDNCPGLYEAYRKKCFSGELTINSFFLYKPLSGPNVLCFPTKEEWWNPSNVRWVDDNLKKLATEYEQMGIESLAMVAVGCGKGELDYIYSVKPLIHRYLGPVDLEVDVLFYNPKCV